MVLKPANKCQIIWQCRNFKNILIDDILDRPFHRGKNVNIISYKPLNSKPQRESIIYYFIYSCTRKVFCKTMQHKYFKEIWFVLWCRSVSFWGIIVMYDTKYLNKYSKLWHFAEYLGKLFLMRKNSKSFSSV